MGTATTHSHRSASARVRLRGWTLLVSHLPSSSPSPRRAKRTSLGHARRTLNVTEASVPSPGEWRVFRFARFDRLELRAWYAIGTAPGCALLRLQLTPPARSGGDQRLVDCRDHWCAAPPPGAGFRTKHPAILFRRTTDTPPRPASPLGRQCGQGFSGSEARHSRRLPSRLPSARRPHREDDSRRGEMRRPRRHRRVLPPPGRATGTPTFLLGSVAI